MSERAYKEGRSDRTKTILMILRRYLQQGEDDEVHDILAGIYDEIEELLE